VYERSLIGHENYPKIRVTHITFKDDDIGAYASSSKIATKMITTFFYTLSVNISPLFFSSTGLFPFYSNTTKMHGGCVFNDAFLYSDGVKRFTSELPFL